MGHRIIEINGQSVVATPHEKIIQILTQAVSEVSRSQRPCATGQQQLHTEQDGLRALPQHPPARGLGSPS